MTEARTRFRYVPAAQLLLATMFVWMPFDNAHAYVGPGLGVGTIIVILGFLGSLLLAVFGLFWYPVKRLLRKRAAAEQGGSDEADDVAVEGAEQKATDP